MTFFFAHAGGGLVLLVGLALCLSGVLHLVVHLPFNVTLLIILFSTDTGMSDVSTYCMQEMCAMFFASHVSTCAKQC